MTVSWFNGEHMTPVVSIVLKEFKNHNSSMSLKEKTTVFLTTVRPNIYYDFPKGTYYVDERDLDNLLSATRRYGFASQDSVGMNKQGHHCGCPPLTTLDNSLLATILDDRLLHNAFIVEINQEHFWLKFRTNQSQEFYYACLFQLTNIESFKEQQ